MHVVLSKDHEELSSKVARRLEEIILNNPSALICLTSGSTPIRAYEIFVRRILDNNINISKIKWVSLDEWVGMDATLKGSCGNSILKAVFEPLNIQQYHLFDGTKDLSEECQKMDDYIALHGGVLDFMLVGLGTNGHVGLNEPNTKWPLKSHVTDLEQSTIEIAQKYFDTPTVLSKGITLGLSYFTHAQNALMMASGSSKADVVYRIFSEEPSEKLPASIIRTTETSSLYLDHEAALKIK